MENKLFESGNMIIHDTYGHGVVVQVNESTCKVKFDIYGEKELPKSELKTILHS